MLREYLSLPNEHNDSDEALETLHEEQHKEEVNEPPKYKILLHNDDFTPMDFVVFVLYEVFNLTEEQANALMLYVHIVGTGIVGVYPFEIAEMKIFKAATLAQSGGYPLMLTMEKES